MILEKAVVSSSILVKEHLGMLSHDIGPKVIAA